MHFLTEAEEHHIKRTVPWESLDVGVRELVRLYNTIDGLATVQSCAGHVTPHSDGFSIDCAHITLRVAERWWPKIVGVFFEAGVRDITLRQFNDGSFWVSAEVDPGEKHLLYTAVRALTDGHVPRD